MINVFPVLTIRETEWGATIFEASVDGPSYHASVSGPTLVGVKDRLTEILKGMPLHALMTGRVMDSPYAMVCAIQPDLEKLP